MQCNKGTGYIYNANIRDNEQIRRSFNELAQKTFGLSFEQWYQNGYWGDSYIPHVLFGQWPCDCKCLRKYNQNGVAKQKQVLYSAGNRYDRP